MVKCPACGRTRIRSDYHSAPLYLRIFLIRALLCDYCNLQFRAFSLKAPQSHSARRAKRKADTFVAQGSTAVEVTEEGKEVRVDTDESAVGEVRPAESEKGGSGRDIVDPPGDLREESGTEVTTPVNSIAPVPATGRVSAMRCPKCASSDIVRRHRTRVERIVFGLTGHRAYVCRQCKAQCYLRMPRSR